MKTIHKTAEVSEKASIGNDTKVWHFAHIRENATIGDSCIIGKNVYIDFDVKIGNKCKVQNNSSIYHGANIEDGVFIGPHVVITNDKYPRAINIDGSLKGNSDWTVLQTNIGYGASIGANSVVLPGIKIGRFALIGSGSVVTKDVPDFGLVYGNPAKLAGYVNEAGQLVKKLK
ncbi:N-acetyltransferase [Candidatus Peregrinibacteria bacterium]|nr:N-acetyltransferase [Candidatus Peregrinibacteria bacterium]